MRIIDCEQGSAEWLQNRVGRITASRICEAMSRYAKKDGETAERKNYKTDMIVERLTGRSTENFVSPEMIWGRDNEQAARTAYEMEKGVMTQKVGFILHPTLDHVGASPDSLVDDGGLEIKCPKTATHIKWMLAGVVPEEHVDQVQLNIACAETAWWDFMSYDPRLPEGIDRFIVRVPRDDKRIADMEAEAVQFNAEIEQVIAFLRKREVKRPAPPVDTRPAYEQLMSVMDAVELVP